MTAIARSSPNASSVRSSRAVLPDPGELARLKAGTAASSSRRRIWAASSSFRAMTRSRISIVRTVIVHLQVGQPKIRAGPLDQLRGRTLEGRLREEGLETEAEVGRLDPGVVT